MNLDHEFVQVSKLSEDQQKKSSLLEDFFSPNLSEDLEKKRSSPKLEDFFSPNSSEDQEKKGLHQIWKTFSPRIHVETSAQTQTRVKLLGGCRCRPYSNYWGGYSQIIGRDISPHPSRVSATQSAST